MSPPVSLLLLLLPLLLLPLPLLLLLLLLLLWFACSGAVPQLCCGAGVQHLRHVCDGAGGGSSTHCTGECTHAAGVAGEFV
jgi:hypothetical protein